MDNDELNIDWLEGWLGGVLEAEAESDKGGSADVQDFKRRQVRMLLDAAAKGKAVGASGVPEGWNPIDTAPKDGRWILATWVANERVQEKVHWSDMHRIWVHHGNVKVAPDGWLPVDSGEPYVPEEVRWLPERWRRYIGDPDGFSETAATEINSLADELEAALASAPAVPNGWILVPRKPTKGMCHAGCEVSVSPDVPAEIWNAMIAAAPTDGSGDADA